MHKAVDGVEDKVTQTVLLLRTVLEKHHVSYSPNL